MGSMIPLVIWSAVWTGLALWHAARRQEKWWFILFLLVHTAGVIEILYLIFVAKIFAKSSVAKKKKK
jgi:methionyl-tRNA synthetase